jgi:hypothetical protein
MGLFRRKDERAIPKPGTPEFDQAVKGTAIPDEQSVSMGEPGWTDSGAEPEQPAVDELPGGAGDQTTGDADAPGRSKRVLGALGRSVLKPPNTEGFGGGISTPRKKPKDEDSA